MVDLIVGDDQQAFDGIVGQWFGEREYLFLVAVGGGGTADRRFYVRQKAERGRGVLDAALRVEDDGKFVGVEGLFFGVALAFGDLPDGVVTVGVLEERQMSG
ncbi:hypothetical protein AADEFJLK_00053 [Methylovulum psychrotolerans]|uniref:Uncharacterized protein n=1 Tax=Methylovulum psychrotolerans TaxID=1704499 RepID=A0A2S5CQG8_9GAMM|nr:hypothetical protein AADEFJLK_00053 [Methylovulum psychrotolerans]